MSEGKITIVVTDTSLVAAVRDSLKESSVQVLSAEDVYLEQPAEPVDIRPIDAQLRHQTPALVPFMPPRTHPTSPTKRERR